MTRVGLEVRVGNWCMKDCYCMAFISQNWNLLGFSATRSGSVCPRVIHYCKGVMMFSKATSQIEFDKEIAKCLSIGILGINLLEGMIHRYLGRAQFVRKMRSSRF
jgi:hypothetical protein